MKIKLLPLFFSLAAMLLFSSYTTFYPGGSPSAKTGSPGDGSSCSSCHGQAATTSAGLITSDIPASGYVPGTTYQITATTNQTGSGKYGFEVSPQNVSGTQLGTLIAGSGSKLVGGTKYVTQSNANTTTKSWTFGWTAPAAGTGAVTFYGAFARNYSGPTVLSTLVVQEAASTPAAAGPITGQASVCASSTGNYSVGTIAGATSYVWTVPSGATITSGQGTTSIGVSFGASAGSGSVSVYGSNTNGNGAPSSLTVTINVAPSAAGAVTGSTTPCQTTLQTYSVANVAGVTYTWTVPSGSTILSGQGTNSVNVTIGSSSGNVSVVPSNNCGTATSSELAITISPVPAQTSSITGNGNPCQASTQTYSVTNVAGVNYSWNVPSGSTITSGQGTNSINVTMGATSGTVAVVPSNTCGNGSSTTIDVTVNTAPAAPAAPSGPLQVDLFSVVSSNYTTTTAADSYVWEISPVGAGTIIGTTATASVTWNTGFIGNAEISVKGVNTCGESAWSPVATTQVTNTTGVDNNAAHILVTSNNAGYVTLVLNTDANLANVMILDLSGRILLNTSISGTVTQQLDKQLKPGVYIITVDAGSFQLKKKILITA